LSPAPTPSVEELRKESVTVPVTLKLSSPTRQIAEVEAEYIQIPSAQGKMGVLPNHAPLRAVLEPGLVTCRLKDGSEIVFAVSTGLALVENNVVTVLADSAENAMDIDLDRAERARLRAQERLHTIDSQIDHARAETALKRSIARIQAYRVVHH
jgi:F-type H+-transporting ATPase subunit epsilon